MQSIVSTTETGNDCMEELRDARPGIARINDVVSNRNGVSYVDAKTSFIVGAIFTTVRLTAKSFHARRRPAGNMSLRHDALPAGPIGVPRNFVWRGSAEMETPKASRGTRFGELLDERRKLVSTV